MKNINQFAITRSYTLDFNRINKIDQLAKELTDREGSKVNSSEVVRRAIDLLYEEVNPQAPEGTMTREEAEKLRAPLA